MITTWNQPAFLDRLDMVTSVILKKDRPLRSHYGIYFNVNLCHHIMIEVRANKVHFCD